MEVFVSALAKWVVIHLAAMTKDNYLLVVVVGCHKIYLDNHGLSYDQYT